MNIHKLRRKWWFISVSLIFLLCLGCEKPPLRGLVKVHAINVLTGEGIEGVYAKVSKLPPFSNGKTLTEGYTDADGELRLTFWNTNTFSSHSFAAVEQEGSSIDSYFKSSMKINDEDRSYGSVSLVWRGKWDITLELAPTAYFNLHYTNVNYFDENDQLDFSWKNLDVKNDDDSTGGNSLFGHVDAGYSLGGQMKAAGNHYIEWWVTRDGNTTHFEDYFYVAPWDTTQYQINY